MPQDHNADAGAVDPNEPPPPSHPCPCCGGRMITIEIFERGSTPRHRPTGPITAIRIDTSLPPSLSFDDAVTTSASAGYAPAAITLAQMRRPIIQPSPP